MRYVAEDSTLRFKFNTRRFSSGAPYTLAGTPSLAVYPEDSTTEITAGITLSADYDSVTGLNNVVIDLSASASYAAGKGYQVVIAAGTVDSVSVVGSVVYEFYIHASGGFEFVITKAASLPSDPADASDIAAAIAGLNDLSAADVNAEVDQALVDIHLDHLLAVDYDPSSKPGVSTALLNEIIENDGGVSRLTANALEQAPSGSGSSASGGNDVVFYEGSAGDTDTTVTIFVRDPASTDGSGKTGLTASDLTVSYTRTEDDNDVTVTDVTSSLSDLTALTDAHTDWGLKEVSSTLQPGYYRLDIADAVLATGATHATVYAMITTSEAAPSRVEIEITTPVTISDIAEAVRTEMDSNSTKLAAILLDTAEIGAAGAGLTAINLPDQTMNITGNITGNLSGSVGSVTGSVGGSVASVTGLTASDVGAIKLVTDKLDDTLEDSGGGAHIFTEPALANAPSGTGASAASIVAAMFTTDSGQTESTAVAGSVVYEIVQNVSGGGGGGDATEAKQDTIIGLLGTPEGASVSVDIAAVKGKTDQLTFTVSNRVDANITHVAGDGPLIGSGVPDSDPWRVP